MGPVHQFTALTIREKQTNNQCVLLARTGALGDEVFYHTPVRLMLMYIKILLLSILERD